jgi:hypothetical protein
MCVDTDHAGNKPVRRSTAGFMIFMNMAMVQWHSKQHTTVEGAVYGAEFVAVKQGIEELRGIRYKLQLIGVGLGGPAYAYGDNMSVIYNNNTLMHKSVLKKKSTSICYHFIRGAVATKECLTTHVPTLLKWANFLTNFLSGKKSQELGCGVMFHSMTMVSGAPFVFGVSLLGACKPVPLIMPQT